MNNDGFSVSKDESDDAAKMIRNAAVEIQNGYASIVEGRSDVGAVFGGPHADDPNIDQANETTKRLEECQTYSDLTLKAMTEVLYELADSVQDSATAHAEADTNTSAELGSSRHV